MSRQPIRWRSPAAKQYILPDSTVFTDEHRGYLQLPRHGYRRHRIRHSAKVYVAGDVDTQTIEGFWSLLKRGLADVYHSVGEDYLQSYLDEYAWRYNHRKDGQAMFRTLLDRAFTTPAA
jgi:transposase